MGILRVWEAAAQERQQRGGSMVADGGGPPQEAAAADNSEEELDGEDVDGDDSGELELDAEEELDGFEGAGGAALEGVDYFFSSGEDEGEDADDWFVEHGWQDDSGDEDFEDEELDEADLEPSDTGESGAPARSGRSPPCPTTCLLLAGAGACC